MSLYAQAVGKAWNWSLWPKAAADWSAIGPQVKDILAKMAPKRESPSAVSGGGGGALNERGRSLWGTFFECLVSVLFQMLFLRLRTLFRRFWASILATLGGFFGVFSYLGGFLKIALPCRRELKIQGPGITEIAQKSNKKCIWLWDWFGKPIFYEIRQFL